jgi:prolyl oligopeptidase
MASGTHLQVRVDFGAGFRNDAPMIYRPWVIAVLLLSCGAPSHSISVPPPTTAQAFRTPDKKLMMDRPETRVAVVSDMYHGVSVADPYRWLEEGESTEVQAWTNLQNARTRRYMDTATSRPELLADLSETLRKGSIGMPAVRKDLKTGLRSYFHTRREGAQNQPVLYLRTSVTGADAPLLDPSTLSSDGTTALDWWFPSNDGGLVAWGSSENGSEESVLRIRDTKTGRDLTEVISRTRHASVAWAADGGGFYYSRYPAKGTVPAGDEKYNSRILFHTLGTDPNTDAVIFGEGREKTDTPIVAISPNGRWLLVTVHMGWDKNELFLRELKPGKARVVGSFVPLIQGKRALTDVAFDGDSLFIRTNDEAPKYQVFRAEAADSGNRARWTLVLKEGADVLESVDLTETALIASYLSNASSRIDLYSKTGVKNGEVKLPGIGTAHVQTSLDGVEAFVSFTSHVTPAEVYQLGKPPSALSLWDRVSGDPAGAGIEVTRMFATSKDGTKVPMFVIAKAGFAHDGARATVLHGYGGFNVSQTPAFNARALTVAKRGGVWVTAILRGGGEFGEDWHRAGMLEKKQNVFDDYLACAAALMDGNITNPAKLAAFGGSNGGLLVSAAVTQRPDLFRAGASLVPLTDMLRYHKFRIGALWIPEYGSSEKPEDFKSLFAYSPYHHVNENTPYPAMLFTTAESDSRVDPMHARKMAARMQRAQRDETHPILLRVETKAGHGAGKPISKLAEEMADELAFLDRELSMTR